MPSTLVRRPSDDPPPPSPAAASREERAALAGMVMRLFEHWKLGAAEQLELLGLSVDNRAALSRYRQGEPLANSRDLLERVGHLLAIHKSLRILLPDHRELAYRWMSTPNRAFEGASPVQVVRDHGFVGLLTVRAYLDRQRG